MHTINNNFKYPNKEISEMSIKKVARLPSIRDIKPNSPITSPTTDYFGDEMLVIANDIKRHLEDTTKKTKLIKTHFHSMPYKEVPKNYKRWWKKEDIKCLYKGLMKYGYDISFIERYMNYEWSRDQIRRRLHYEYKIRPRLVERAMLYTKNKSN